jgi:hypothetical protein
MGNDHNQANIKEVLNAVMKYYGLTDKFKEHQMPAIWEKVMGQFIASKTNDVKMVKSKLYVKLDSAALRMELQFDREKIKDMINKEVGENFVQEVILG